MVEVEMQPTEQISLRQLDSPLEYGDFIVLYGSHDQIYSVDLEFGGITNNKFGNYHHEDIVGKCFNAPRD